MPLVVRIRVNLHGPPLYVHIIPNRQRFLRFRNLDWPRNERTRIRPEVGTLTISEVKLRCLWT